MDVALHPLASDLALPGKIAVDGQGSRFSCVVLE
jgi:hypothetical protein